jgi:hypothetical protein
MSAAMACRRGTTSEKTHVLPGGRHEVTEGGIMIPTQCEAIVHGDSTFAGACVMKPELDLDTMLREPIVQLMMERDGIASGDVRQIFQRIRSARALRDRDQDASPPPGGRT